MLIFVCPEVEQLSFVLSLAKILASVSHCIAGWTWNPW